MTIIQNGATRWWTGCQTTCGYCRTAFGLEASDDVVELGQGSGPRRNGQFQCSVCGHAVTVSKTVPAIE